MNTLAQTTPAADAEKPLPVVGQWYWVKDKPDSTGDIDPPALMCCEHVGSNYARFCHEHGDERYCNKHYREAMLWESDLWDLEPNWRQHWEKEMQAGQARLHSAILALADQYNTAGLTPQLTGGGPPSMALATSSGTVEEQKAVLVAIRDTALPDLQKSVKQITGELVGYQKNLFLDTCLLASKMMDAKDAIEQKLFALELYAGFGECVRQIQDGAPADSNAPVHILQMLRYMDEETLIAAEEDGFDFNNLECFDKWAAQNIDTIAPYPRCIMAWKVRRHKKDRGQARDLATLLEHLHFEMEDQRTYLLIRNGGRIYRAATELEFEPRLIPLRKEFSGPLIHRSHRFRGPDEEEIITPQDIRYDDYSQRRSDTMRHYNRIVFLIQGLLDRSDVFAPHPPIDLSGPDASHWLVQVRDEEDGLPTSEPVKWDDYRDACNKPLKKGDMVYAKFEHKHTPRSWRDKTEWWAMSGLFRFEGFTKDEKNRPLIKLSVGGQTRRGWEFPKEKYVLGKGYTQGTWGEWPAPRAHYKCRPDEVFRLASYTPGLYKKFLCDAHAKGAYLKWSRHLLAAERWHKKGRPSDDEPPRKKISRD